MGRVMRRRARRRNTLRASRDRYRALLVDADVDLPAAHGDLDRREAHARIARMAAGLQVELEAVPRTYQVARFREAQPGAAHVGRERLLDFVIDLALAHRAAGMRAHVLIGEDLVAETEHADLHAVDGKDAVVAVVELGERRDRHVLRSVACGHVLSLPERDGTTSPRRTN